MTFPRINLSPLPPNTIVPEDEDLFIPYLNRLYEDISFAVNERDASYFPIPITSTASDIPNIPNFGAFVLCVSGESSEKDGSGNPIGWLPTLTVSLCKSDATAAGSIAVLGSQAGTGTWAANTLTVTSTDTNFRIAHNRVGKTGNFNIRILGTQS